MLKFAEKSAFVLVVLSKTVCCVAAFLLRIPADRIKRNRQTIYTAHSYKMKNLPSHFQNKEAHSVGMRYGIPIFIALTFGLILASHIGSGVSAELVFTDNGIVVDEAVILTVSIFTSVSALWNAKSYALTILVVVTSVSWPYLKLILALFSWFAPIWNPLRREKLIHTLDVLGKWSFVDIFVLLIVTVAFRTTTDQGRGLLVEVFIEPQWGFYGFVFASIMSLVVTHLILYRHRMVIYDKSGNLVEFDSKAQDRNSVENGTTHTDDNNEEETTNSLFPRRLYSNEKVFCLASLAASFALLLSGACVLMFTFNYSIGSKKLQEKFSLATIGIKVPQVSRYNPNRFGVRWIQIMYYILSIAAPLWNLILLFILYFIPMRKAIQRRLLFLCEVTFAWGAAEVFIISAIFSVFQIPKFGTGA